MIIDDKKRDEAYRKLTSQTIKDLYRLPESGEQMFAIFNRHSLPESKYRKYAEIVGDAILGFFSPDTLSTRFVSDLLIEKQIADILQSDLINFLNPLINQNSVAAKSKKQLSAVEPLRTMETDARKIHGYGAYRTANPTETDADEEVIQMSSQDNTLSPTKPVAERPTYTPPKEVVEEVEKKPEPVSGFTPRED